MSGNGNGNAVAMLSDDLIARAKAIASRSDELLHLLEDTRQRLVDPGERPPIEPASKPRPVPESKKASGNGKVSKASGNGKVSKASGNGKVSEGLRLLTTQMAVAGAGRDEIAERLRDEFGVRDPAPILKDMGL
jgi:hypothetical protein